MRMYQHTRNTSGTSNSGMCSGEPKRWAAANRSCSLSSSDELALRRRPSPALDLGDFRPLAHLLDSPCERPRAAHLLERACGSSRKRALASNDLRGRARARVCVCVRARVRAYPHSARLVCFAFLPFVTSAARPHPARMPGPASGSPPLLQMSLPP